MPTFLVRFPQPVVYQPDHPQARRTITDLLVHAPDALGAQMHAVRVVQGDVSGMTVDVFWPTQTRPPVESIPDIRQNFFTTPEA